VSALLAEVPAAFIAVALLVGLLVGSFLNVVIHRLPRMLERAWRAECAALDAGAAPDSGSAPSRQADTAAAGAAGTAPPAARYDLIAPRSACPACHAPIAARHNIPVLSWLLLRGRCAHCAAPISPRYPLVEAATGILTALVAWRFGFGLPALFAMLITWYLIAAALIDLEHQLLPDALTLPLLWGGLLASLLAPLSPAASLPVDPRAAILGAAAGYLSLWCVYHLFRLLTGKEGMGYGDFKLLGALGAWLGWQMLLPIVIASAAVGALTGIALIVLRRHERGVPIPFGPFLAAAGWLALMWGPDWVADYLGLFRP
jgi:leader peptidase (prepilin peptidase)/N-methyltransferase